MTLSFSTQIDGKPNYFIEKIWEALLTKTGSISSLEYDNFYRGYIGNGWDILSRYSELNQPKIHTIREDKKDRWKPGNKIHFIINNRTKDRFQFAPVIPVKSVQKIGIRPHAEVFRVKIDNHFLNDDEIETLAINDGFDSSEDFFKYFNSNFDGKIIHWTSYSYCG